LEFLHTVSYFLRRRFDRANGDRLPTTTTTTLSGEPKLCSQQAV
jgi:hypothetical protein